VRRQKLAEDDEARRHYADIKRLLGAHRTYRGVPEAQLKLEAMKAGVIEAAKTLYASRVAPAAIDADFVAMIAHHDASRGVCRNGPLTNSEWGRACGAFFDSQELLRRRGDGGHGMIEYIHGSAAMQRKEQRKEAISAALLQSFAANGRRARGAA
jgi:hypothetical protein